MIWEMRSRSLDCGEQVRIMGILNVTPDSFFDGRRYLEREAAVERALQMVEEGADLVDVGGESSRPPMYGEARALPVAEECDRVVPVVEGVRQHSDVLISVDTVKAEVARQALQAGADIINDISALSADAEMAGVAAESGAGVILMHRRGTPATMQLDTQYANLLEEITEYLAERLEAGLAAGIEQGHMAVDPGIGFGKSVVGNLQLVEHLDVFAKLGCPVLVGASRKSFIWRTLELAKDDSLEGSLAVGIICVLKGVHILRVHDVEATVRAVRMTEAVVRSDADAASAMH